MGLISEVHGVELPVAENLNDLKRDGKIQSNSKNLYFHQSIINSLVRTFFKGNVPV